MSCQRHREIRRRRQRYQKIRKLRTRLKQTTNPSERARLIAKIRRASATAPVPER